MENIYIKVSVAFATNRKRKIFTEPGVRIAFADISKEILESKGVQDISIVFYPYAVCITESLPIGLTPEESAKIVKYATSSYIRKQFPKYSKMNALWTRKLWWKQGKMDAQKTKEMTKFFNEQKNR